jgi:hypothetical protein
MKKLKDCSIDEISERICCIICKTDLKITYLKKTAAYYFFVEPCEKCSREIHTKGYDEGFEQGYDIGHEESTKNRR